MRQYYTRHYILPCSYILTSLILLIFPSFKIRADHYSDYIEEYKDMAIEQQIKYGIPASITLAQGLLESAAGRSALAREGNNHFGIKCHKDWTGETMLRNDDAPDECFRVYKNAKESFNDHSQFLCRRRYQPLFEHDITDYTSWATGLSACGYATDPNYANRLIAIIERYSLNRFDTPSGRKGEDVAEFIMEHLRNSHTIRKFRGLHYVIATPGDTYSSLAKEFHIELSKLLAYNDIHNDMPVVAWQEVYLQDKLNTAPNGMKSVTVGEEDTMHSLSQRYGIKLSRLKELNKTDHLKAGDKLRLRESTMSSKHSK